MARHLIPSDRTVQALKPGIKRLNDGAGLHLRQSPGGKHWYQDFTFNRVRCTLSLGAYPEVGLAEARRRSHDMRTDVAHGINPVEKRKAEANAERERQTARSPLGRRDAQPGSFEHLARAWIEVRTYAWSDTYTASVVERLEKHVFPVIGWRPISSIQRSEFTDLFKGIDDADTKAAYTRTRGLNPIRYAEMVREYLRDHQRIENAELRELLGLGNSPSAQVEASRYPKKWSQPDGFLDRQRVGSTHVYTLRLRA